MPKRKATPSDDTVELTPPTQSKRQRVSQACDPCRIRKDKCDGQRPTCSACTIAARVCVYGGSQKKRGLPPGYVRTLERLWALAFSKIPSSQDATLRLLQRGESQKITQEIDAMDDLDTRWRDSRVKQTLDRLLCGNQDDHSDSPSERSTDRIEGDGSVFPQWSIPDMSNTEITGVEDRTALFPTPRSLDVNPTADIQPVPIANTASILGGETTYQLPFDALELLDIYFTYTHCWFPIVERHKVLRTFHTYKSSEDGGKQKSSQALLWSIFSLASYQKTVAKSLEHLDCSEKKDSPDVVYAKARALLPEEKELLELEDIQSLLVLSLVNSGRARLQAAWAQVGLATRGALLLKDRFTPSAPGRTASISSELTHRVIPGCYLLDVSLAICLRTHSHLRSMDIARHEQDVDGIEEWEPWVEKGQLNPTRTEKPSSAPGEPQRGLSTFKLLISLAAIIDEAYDKDGDTVEERLSKWYHALPDFCRLHPSSPKDHAPHHYNLHLIYHIAVINSRDTNESTQSNRSTLSASQFHTLLEEFSGRFHASGISPIILSLTDIALANVENQEVQSLKDRLVTAWGTGLSTETHTYSTQIIPPQLAAFDPLSLHTQGQSFGAPRDYSDLHPNPLPPPLPPPIEGQQLTYANTTSVAEGPADLDVDTLFDELASLDTTDTYANQPIFMQNLGLMPDTIPSQLFTFWGQPNV